MAANAFDWAYELNRPPFTVDPFSITPVGGLFLAMYGGYLSWQIFRPPSEQEIEMEARRESEAQKAAEMAPGFLQAAAEEEGAQVQPSGLVFKELVPGTGTQPGPKQKVKVHYEGKLADGTVFDSSIQRGEPTEFPLDQVIAGWREGLQLMKEGGKARLTLPAQLGYGSMGTQSIPGNSALQFEVELLELKETGGGFSLPF